MQLKCRIDAQTWTAYAPRSIQDRAKMHKLCT